MAQYMAYVSKCSMYIWKELVLLSRMFLIKGMYIKLMVMLKSFVWWLCLLVLPFIEKGVLKPLTVIVNLSISFCSSVSFILYILKLLLNV